MHTPIMSGNCYQTTSNEPTASSELNPFFPRARGNYQKSLHSVRLRHLRRFVQNLMLTDSAASAVH